MAHDGGSRRLRRREAIVLAGLLAGFASAAILSQIVDPRPAAVRGAI